MEKPELYVVNTDTAAAWILEMSADRRWIDAYHLNFCNRVRAAHPDFDFPYMELFSNGIVVIQESISGGQHTSVRRGHTLSGEPLDESIARFRIGDGTCRIGEKTPITAVVEFSPTELYPEVMERLAQRYDIKRISV